MIRWYSRAFVLLLCGLVCASTAVVSFWPRGGVVRTEDRNGDGRPDVWRTYNRQGQLIEMALDTNFDGRLDVHEYYEQGALTRRESDRNFDGRVDLVEAFDRVSGERVRSVVDVDYDGRADLLVLFHEGRAVYSKWAVPVTSATASGHLAQYTSIPRHQAADLAPLDDPFRTDLAVRAVASARGADDCGGLSLSGGVPAPRDDVVTPPAPSSDVPASAISLPSSATLGPFSPRGPPASPLFA